MDNQEVQLNGFFMEDDNSEGHFDFNMEEYKPKQIEMANYIEDLTGMELWGTKPKFSVYDYHIVKYGNRDNLMGTATVIPGVPLCWTTPINGIAEFKFRTNHFTKYPTTVVDSEKMRGLMAYSRDLNMPCWIVWKFTDAMKYYKVNPNHKFKHKLNHNYKTAANLQHEEKPVAEIPISYLSDCTPDMFEWESSDEV